MKSVKIILLLLPRPPSPFSVLILVPFKVGESRVIVLDTPFRQADKYWGGMQSRYHWGQDAERRVPFTIFNMLRLNSDSSELTLTEV